MAKKLDNAGRVIIPRELRRSLKWMDGDLIEMYQKDNTLVLSKYHPQTSDKLKAEFSFFLEWAEDTGLTIPKELTEEFYSVVDKIEKLEN